MKNIDRLRQMSTKDLAAFLDDCGAETPPDICDYCDGCQNGEDCKYQSDGTAWENWLEREAK